MTKTKSKELPAVVARIEYNPLTKEKFGVDDMEWKALVESVHPTASCEASVFLVLSYCKARNLDPLKKFVHIVPIWDKSQKQMVDTVWPSLVLHRTEAHRSGNYAGCDECQFGEMITEKLGNQEVTYPEWAQFTVYKMVGGQRCAFPGPKVKWKEYYARYKKGEAAPNAMWSTKTEYMIEKVAESMALRRAWPEECSDPTAEEMEHQTMVDITPPRKTSADVAAEKIAANQDPIEGEKPKPEAERKSKPNEAEDISPEDEPEQINLEDPFVQRGMRARENGRALDEVPPFDTDQKAMWELGWKAQDRKEKEMTEFQTGAAA